MNNEDKILAILEQIQDDVSGLKQDVDGMKQRQVDLATLVHGIIAHQDEDYALLQSVDNKVDHLSNISHAHEEKFRRLKAL